MPSGSDYQKRLLEETGRCIAPKLISLQEALQSLRSHLTISLDQIEPRIEAIRSADFSNLGAIVGEAVREAEHSKLREVASISQFARRLRAKDTQEEILALLLETAGQFAARAALLVIRDGRVFAWSSWGFGSEAAEKMRARSFSLPEIPALAGVIDGDSPAAVEDSSTVNLLREWLGINEREYCRLYPMTAMQRTVAVLAAVDSEPRPAGEPALEVLLQLTALHLENMALRVLLELEVEAEPEEEKAAIGVRASAPQAPAPAEPSPAAIPEKPTKLEEPRIVIAEAEPPAALAPEEAEVEAPIRPAEEPPEAIEQEPAVVETPPAESAARPAPEETAVEAARAEAGTAAVEVETDAELEAALEFIGKPSAPAAEAAKAPEPERPHPAPAPLPESQGLSEEEKLHTDARRFARLLVSEIKLYNEQRLTEGRTNGDIYSRLKRDIDRSREMYQRRIPPMVAQKFDYFNDEIVRILAENDPTKLGSDYPGPRVEG